jgi:hypothetical protein
MKTASSRRLFDYWNQRRGSRAAPERGDLEPGAIRQLLADTFVLALDPPAGHPLRLAGTRMCALFCRELRGEPFQCLWNEASRPQIRELISIVTEEASPAVGGVCARPSGDYPAADLELLLLPLYHRGVRNARMLGMLAPIGVPFWLGTSPVAGLSLGALRHLGTGAMARVAPPVLAAGRPGRVRNGFLVYDGGRR